jgi:hypothetical protein
LRHKHILSLYGRLCRPFSTEFSAQSLKGLKKCLKSLK